VLILLAIACSHPAFAICARAHDSAAEAQSESAAPAKKKAPKNSYSFGLQLGMAQVGTGSVRNPTYISSAMTLPVKQLEDANLLGEGCTILDKRCRTESRRGFHLGFPIQVGGSIVGFRFEPYMTLAAAAKAYGIYMGPTFEYHAAHPLYLGLGFGLKVAWVKDKDWKYAADIYGRIPLRVTYYLVQNFGLVFEFGFGAGASGYVSALRDVLNPMTGKTIARRTDMTFGFGRTWDFSFGVRFP
jgi:hypothetical protein